MAETKLQTDAVARAHGVPVTLLPFDLTSILTEFKRKFGNHIADDRLPSQSICSSTADGTLKAEPLSHVVSLFEEEQQDLKKPELARQYNLQLDSRLTVTTKRRHISSEPTDEKGLRLEYAVLSNLPLLEQMRQPGRSTFKDLNRATFTHFLDTLLDSDNFSFFQEVDGRTLVCFTKLVFLLVIRIRIAQGSHPTLQRAVLWHSSCFWTALRQRTSYEALASAHCYSEFWTVIE